MKQYVAETLHKIYLFTADIPFDDFYQMIEGAVAKVHDSHIYLHSFRTLFPPTGKTFDMKLEIADGQEITVKGLSTKSGAPKYVRNSLDFRHINWHKEMYSLKMHNDSTAYIGLTTFQLNEVQVENIAGFIDSISKAAVPNLIFDVRNNGGGHVDVLEKLY